MELTAKQFFSHEFPTMNAYETEKIINVLKEISAVDEAGHFRFNDAFLYMNSV